MQSKSIFSRRTFLTSTFAAGASVAVAASARGLGVFAQETESPSPAWVVNADGVNIRSEPGLQSDVVATVNTGEILLQGAGEPVGGDGHLWLNVTREADGTSGWIAADFVDPVNGDDGPPVGTIFYNTLEGANLRTAPSASADVITELFAGEITVIAGPQQVAEGITWYYVQAGGHGQWTGWIDSSVLTEEDPPPGEDFPPGTTVAVTADQLNLRAEPSEAGAVVGTYPYSTMATVISSASTPWIEVEIQGDGAVGFFHSDFLVADEPTEDITVTNGPLSVRIAPGLDGDVIDSMAAGETASLGAGEPRELDGHLWIPVVVSQTGTEGWVAAEFTDYGT